MLDPSPELDCVARQIVDSAFAVHTTLGPGLMESVYEQCLGFELGLRRLTIRTQDRQAIQYKEMKIEAGLGLDMVVEECVVVEVKAVDRLLPVCDAQLLT